MPSYDQILPIRDAPAPRRRHPPGPANRLVVAVVYDGLCSFEYGCAAEVFGLPRPEFGGDWYRFEACAIDAGPLHALGGLRVHAANGLARLAHAGTIVIPGWKHVDAAPPPKLLRALRAAHARGARIVTICSGVFVLAATGLLDGRRATTHWRYAAALQARHPRIEVDPNVLYVDAGQLLTSAGSAAGLDLCLHLVRRDWGAERANLVARRLVIAPHRSGGQAQFIEQPVLAHGGDRLAALLDELRARPARRATIAQMARRVAMSERTFMRKFRQATGQSPADWLTATRVENARQLLETSALAIDVVAQRCGFGSAITLRHHFRRKVGLSPAEYRRRFLRA